MKLPPPHRIHRTTLPRPVFVAASGLGLLLASACSDRAADDKAKAAAARRCVGGRGCRARSCRADRRAARGGRAGQPVEGGLLRRDARAHLVLAGCLHRRGAPHAGRCLQVRAGQGRHDPGADAQHQEAAGLDRGLRPRGVHRRDVLHAGAGRQGRRQPDARRAARAEERGRAAGLVPEVRHRKQRAARTPGTRRSTPGPRRRAAPGRTSS